MDHEQLIAGLSRFDYQSTLRNNYDQYNAGAGDHFRDPWRQPFIWTDWSDDGLLLQYRRAVHEPTPATDAVIVVHGSNTDPTDVFVHPGGPGTYLNEIGTALAGLGY